MSTGIYERTEKEKKRLRKMIKEIRLIPEKGKSFSPKTEFKKGHVPWNKGKKWIEISGDNHPSRNPKYKSIFENIWHAPNKNGMIGEKHWNWQGGKTALIMQIRNSKQYAEWRNKVYTRDNFTCQLCGDKKGGNLNAHHIEPLFAIIENYKIKTFEDALNCELIWDINNGITICENCHLKADEVGKIRTILCN